MLSEVGCYSNDVMRKALLPLRRLFGARFLKLFVASVGWVFYTVLFALFYEEFGSQMAALVLLPVALIAWLWGLRAGLLAALASFGLNTLLFNLISSPELGGWTAVLKQRGGAGHSATVFVGGVVGHLRDTRQLLLHQRKQLIAQKEQLLHQAQHDVLTGLPNRALFMSRLEQAVAQAERDGNLVAVCFVDLNGFKQINDTLGHAAGDDLLRQVAARLKHRCRSSDTLARMGGDEFTLIATGLQDAQGARHIAGSLLDTLNFPFLLDGQEVSVSASMGLSLYPRDAQGADGLLCVADTAMYRVKRRKNERDEKSYLTLL